MKIRSDYNLVLDFFEWARSRRDSTLEALCIVTHLAVASKDLNVAYSLVSSFWERPKLSVNDSFVQFFDLLVYTYKDWGSDPNVFDVFFRVLVEFGMLREARKVFEKMLSYGLVLSVDSCNLYLSKEKTGTAVIVFKEFPEVGVCWNVASYNIVIHCVCQLGRVSEAHHLLVLMELKGYIPDVVSYSTVINGYCRFGELEKVWKLIEVMREKGLKPNSYTYGSVILLLCRSCKLAEAEEAFREMIGDGIVPDNVVYTTLIDGFCKGGNIKAASKFFLRDALSGYCT